MRINIQFNWPMGQDAAGVEIGQPNSEDNNIDFRIGVVPKDQHDKIYYQHVGWIYGQQIASNIKFTVSRGDRVVVERRNHGNEEILTTNVWDIDKEWPREAYGPSLTFAPWYF